MRVRVEKWTCWAGTSLNLTKLSPDKKWIKFDTLVSNLFIIIFSIKNNHIWIMMSSMFFLFHFRALDQLDIEVLEFRLFTELSILE